MATTAIIAKSKIGSIVFSLKKSAFDEPKEMQTTFLNDVYRSRIL